MRHKQQGLALIEALVASAVLGIGLLGATQLTLKAAQAASDTRERGVAQLLALEALDCARSGSGCPVQVSVQVQGVHYSRTLSTTPAGAGGLQDIQVTVQWTSSTPSPGASHSGTSEGLARVVWRSSASALPGWVGQ